MNVFSRMKTIMILKGMFAVGMRHYGPSSLPINQRLAIVREGQNKYDRNACAVQDNNGRVLAYLERSSAQKIAGLIDSGLIKDVAVKAKYEPENKNRMKGPEQHCYIAFCIEDSSKEKLEQFMAKNCISYHYMSN